VERYKLLNSHQLFCGTEIALWWKSIAGGWPGAALRVNPRRVDLASSPSAFDNVRTILLDRMMDQWWECRRKPERPKGGTKKEMTERKGGALEGIRVIDLTQMLAGPYCTQMLADQGAEVIKIEPPQGDNSRNVGPYRPDDAERRFGGYFATVNRNKKSIVIDLKEEEGRALVRRLVRTADVVVENYRARVMDRLGLSYESLREENPALVYAAIRGFGDPRTGESPYVDWPAFDVVAQAMGGLMGITGPDQNSPIKVGPGVGDIVPGAFAATGILAALLRAKMTGQGQFVDVSMVDVMLAICERIVHQYSFAGTIPHPEGNQHPILAPFGVVKAKDGFVSIAAPTDEWWRKLCEIIGRDDLLADESLATNESRARNRDRVYGAIEAFTSVRTKRELLDILGGRIPFGPVYNIAEIANDPHFAARDMIVDTSHPGTATPVQLAGVPIKLSETPGRIWSSPPLFGEHTDEILGAAGLASTEIAELRRRKIIQ
jgi:crotonobetainyl-CoA:carnitine CoA-transferase CaiB-like acyl-CoA transferase